MKWNPVTIVHDTFEIGIFIKAFDGVLQIFGAVLIAAFKPQTIANWLRIITEHELSGDPHDWIAGHLVNFAEHYSTHGQWFGAFYLASHGVIKIFLVANLWRRKLWAYPTAIVFFILFGLYQIYRFILTGSIGMLLLTILDIIVITLTWLEFRHVKLKLT